MRWCFVLVAACGSHATKHDAGDPPVELHHAAPHLDAPVVTLPLHESFTLLEAGKPPTSLLRYATPAAGDARVETVLRSRHGASDAWSAWTQLDVRDGFGVAPGALVPLPAEALAPSAEASAYLHTWSAVQGRRLAVAVDDRGQLGTVSFADDPSGAHSTRELEEIVQRLLGTLVPVPAEPVGIGAKWRVVTILRQRPAIVKQTATYTLVARSDARWTIAVAMQRIGEEQIVEDPELPKGVAVDLVALVRHYDGTVEVDPAQAFPSGGSLAIDARMHLRIGHLPGPTYEEQLFEDTGKLGFSSHRGK